MKCAECVESGQRSTVTVGPSVTTCMGASEYYDEDGRYHYHDMNTTSTSCRCSNGHEWVKSHKPRCPTCDPEPAGA